MAMRPLRLVVCGAAGRMGSKVLELAGRGARFELAGAVVRGTADFPLLARGADVIVDFTRPEASLAFARTAAKLKRPVVIGTTGFNAVQKSALRRLASRTAVFWAPNMSPAMNVMFELSRRAARWLPDYDAAIFDTHHRMKKDAPSGTALKLAETVGRGMIASVRAGGIVGDHTLLLAGPHDRLELTHRAQSREAFAQGALAAAAWIAGRKPGLYGFSDLLSFKP